MMLNLKSVFNIFKKREESKCDKVLFWMICGIVFFIPLFFITSNSYPIEFNKTLLFSISVSLTAIIYFVKAFKEKKFIISGTLVDWGILGFLVFNIISFIFSKNHYVSAVGISGFYSGGLLATFSFVLFFYLIVNIIRSWENFQKLVIALQMSSLLIIIFNIFQISSIYILPWPETQNYSFNLIANSSLTLAIFSSIILFISLVIYLISEINWQKYLSILTLVSSATLLFLLNKDLPIYLLAGLIVLLLILISTKRKQASNSWTVIPTILVTLLIIFIVFDSMILFDVQVSENILLDTSTAKTIAVESASKYPLWGSGQQTFLYDFSKFRPIEFNNQEFWNIQFLKSSNEWFGLIATLGIGAVSSLLFVFFRSFYKMWQNISYQKSFEKYSFWKVTVFFSLGIIFLMSFFMPFNFFMYFLSWVFLALSISAMKIEQKNSKKYTIDLNKINFKYWGVMAGFSGSIILFLVILIFGGRIWLSDIHYSSAQKGILANEDQEVIFSELEKAINLNPYESKYYLSLAQGYSAQSLLEIENYEINSPELQTYAQHVVDNINQAKLVDPNNSVVYEREADIYDSLRIIIGNVDELSVKAYQKAIELEPTDPLLWLNLGRSRLLLAQEILTNNDSDDSLAEANNQLDTAITDFEYTRTLKKDLAIDYNIGLVYQTKGELDKALEYYFKELNLNQNSINIRYQIALVYEQQGEIELAVDQLKKILELDPGNQSIIDVISELEGDNVE